MDFEKLDLEDFKKLKVLIKDYKNSIGENTPTDEEFNKLKLAIKDNLISFYVAKKSGDLIAMCSVCEVYSTFNFSKSGIFEDFYVSPDFRKIGLARQLTSFVFLQCKLQGIKSLWVGCADVDIDMYKSLGFEIPLGNLLTWSCDSNF